MAWEYNIATLYKVSGRRVQFLLGEFRSREAEGILVFPLL
jgi:hypothetical protein